VLYHGIYRGSYKPYGNLPTSTPALGRKQSSPRTTDDDSATSSWAPASHMAPGSCLWALFVVVAHTRRSGSRCPDAPSGCQISRDQFHAFNIEGVDVSSNSTYLLRGTALHHSAISLRANALITNNLGGLGPETGTPHGIRIANVTTNRHGRMVGLHIYNRTEYRPGNSRANQLRGSMLGMNLRPLFDLSGAAQPFDSNLLPGGWPVESDRMNELHISFSFYDMLSFEPVVLEEFSLSLFDFDQVCGPSNSGPVHRLARSCPHSFPIALLLLLLTCLHCIAANLPSLALWAGLGRWKQGFCTRVHPRCRVDHHVCGAVNAA
jgi:hypothetical protein